MCEPEIITVDNCETCTGNITNVKKPEEDFGKIQNNDNSKIKVSSPETTSRGISSIDILAEYTTKCGITIKVYEGDLSTFPVDVIVNSSNQDLMLQGGLAAVLVKKGWLLLIMIFQFSWLLYMYVYACLWMLAFFIKGFQTVSLLSLF